MTEFSSVGYSALSLQHFIDISSGVAVPTDHESEQLVSFVTMLLFFVCLFVVFF